MKQPTLWIAPPRIANDLLSRDVECLKWQAYLALRGLKDVSVLWSVAPSGGIDGRLPNLQVPMSGPGVDGDGELLAAHLIPTWVDGQVPGEERGSGNDPLEGYRDEAARDESRAWVSLLEGTVHAALLLHMPQDSFWRLLLSADLPSLQPSFQVLLNPAPAPLTGFSSLIPPYGVKVSTANIEAQYRNGISALSDRLSSDKWFLGSEGPTALDALVFAYLHTLIHGVDVLRVEVTRRVNLVAWELRLRSLVQAAFQPAV